MALLSKVNDSLEKLGFTFIVVGYGAMTVITLIEVLRRYFMGMSFSWSEELVRFLLVATTFVGGAVAYKRGSLVLFDALLNRLQGKKAIILAVINHMIIFIFMMVLIRLGIVYIFQPSVMLQKSPGLGISMFVFYSFIPLGFILMMLFSIEFIINGIKQIIHFEEVAE